MKIAIIGAGITGLTAGYRLSRKGHQVFIFEKEKVPGGLARSFKKEDWSWQPELFFHHLFTSDFQAKKLIKELKIDDKLFFLQPKTSILRNNQIFRFDSPLSVLKFPLLSPINRLQTGLVTLALKIYPLGKRLEDKKTSQWLKKYYGSQAYQILWQPLLRGKFGDQSKKISMTWFWARIKKRSSQLGYLQGGFQILIDRLIDEINHYQGKIILNREIKNLKELKEFDKIIITAPTQKFFNKPSLPKMIGAVSLLLVLKEKFLKDDTYWLNINEKNFPFVALVEQTNFIDPKHYHHNHLVYVGGYYPQNHPYFKMTKEEILKEWLPFLKKINPNFSHQTNLLDYYLAQELFAQPIIPPNYSKIIPPHQTPIENVYLANLQQIYPWDRGINYSIELGEKIASLVLNF